MFAKYELMCYCYSMNFLITTFDGFGDGVMYYPLFKEIGEKMPKSKFFYTPNIFFSDESIKNKVQISPNFIPIKDGFRKFPKNSWEELRVFLKNKNIGAIINLRTIGRRFEHDYYDFKDQLISEKSKILFYDEEILKDKEKIGNNIRNIILKIVRKGIGKRLLCRTSFLKILFPVDKNPNQILINMHSRGSFKSWESKKWADLISFLVLSGKKINIYEGFSEGEQLYTKKVMENLPSFAAKKLTILPATNLRDLIKLLQNASLVISVDSGIIHLADSLGINSLGIYITTSPLMWGGVTKKFHYVNSEHLFSCKNFYPFFGMCMNNKQKCEEISGGKDDINVKFVLKKINEICDEKKN